MMQHEITKRIPLLNEKGNLTEAGYAKRLLPAYRRADIKANKSRIKEWDYYYVGNSHYGLALTVADNSYMGLHSVSLLNFDEGWQITKSPMTIMPMGKTAMPETSETGDVDVMGKDYSIHFKHLGYKRVLIVQMKNFGPEGSLTAKIELADEPDESMVIAIPFEREYHFYYNQKINCLRASGFVTYGYGGTTYEFDPADSFGVLDWGRGVWTYKNTWYWGSASGELEGAPFGFNIGYGFGDTRAATENMLIYDGKAHKIGNVSFNIPEKEDGSEDYMNPWTFTSDDGRFEMDFVPVLNRSSETKLGVLESIQNQVFGRFSGKAILDDGTEIRVKDFFGFAEKVRNKW